MSRYVRGVSRLRKVKKNANRLLPFRTRAVFYLAEGKTIPRVGRLLGKTRQAVSYHRDWALNEGILEETNKYPHEYRFTKYGKQRLLNGDDLISVNGTLKVRVHGACLKFPIVKYPDGEGLQRLARDTKKEVAMRNWVSRFIDAGGLEVRISSSYVSVWVNTFPVDSGGFKEAAVLGCMATCLEVACILESKYGFKLDILHPSYVTVPEYAIPDFFTDDGEKVRYSFKTGKIDYSIGKRELEYYDAKHLSDFLSMPEEIKRLQEQITRIEKLLRTLTSAL